MDPNYPFFKDFFDKKSILKLMNKVKYDKRTKDNNNTYELSANFFE